ncbi:2Fe-2S iron-sulfur cluster-binding protein [Acinetobacter sp. Ver3]|uniref:2Fe-2S iron-sulfur cluster-binding protein n=1 Tax=Acinetobacter sp. Ver3 TaxID=466088 RepID=UPI0004530D62|nr:2Fe-2S iron-sulfur cluster-binding protein [Acinetobacter sp. Ver3]EZQ00994.1 2Fe-2S ferredoxin [Acinetobacter sp. Ver3]
MGQITFIEHDGSEHTVEFESGMSLMQIAVNNGVPSIDGDCGGECACGTCHVILEDKWIVKLGLASSNELQMLDLTPEKTNNSRLACQVIVQDNMDGMKVILPEFQM